MSAPSHPVMPRTICTWIFLALCWYGTLAWRPLMEPDEGRYAEIPREMLSSGDWVTPRLVGLDYFEKPPLQYWATAATYAVFGVNEISARAFSATLAFLCLPLVYAFVLSLYGSTIVAATAVLLLASNPLFVVVGQINLLDSAFAFLLSAALFALLKACSVPAGKASAQWALGVWIALALAVLTKGPAALVLCGLTLTLYSVATRDFEPWRRLNWRWGLPSFLLLTIPWFVVVSLRNPPFDSFFFVHEHVARYLTTVEQRLGPWWYFLPLLLLAILPWLKHIWPALRTAVARDNGLTTKPATLRAQRMLWIWCAVVLGVFSMSQSKLAPYIMPMMAPLAVLLAPRLALDVHRARKAAIWIAVFAAVASGAIMLEAYRLGVTTQHAAVAYVIAALVTALLSCLFAGRVPTSRVAADRHTAPQSQVLIVSACQVLTLALLVSAYSVAVPTRSAKLLVGAVRNAVRPDTELYSVGQYRQTIAPYLGRTLRIADYGGELSFGESQLRDPRTIELNSFLQHWSDTRNALAFVEPALYQRLGPALLPGRILAEDAESLVLQR